MDHRLKLFDPEINTNVNSSRSFKSTVKTLYHNKCLLCGVTDEHAKLTVAHLVSHNSDSDYSNFQPPIYKSFFDPASVRNRILLCGTKTEQGTCHNLFDYFNVIIVFNPMTPSYDAVCVKEHSSRPSLKKNARWSLEFPADMSEESKPYKRLLAWRIRSTALKQASSLTAEELQQYVTCADLSEAEEVPNTGESRSDATDSTITDTNEKFE